MGLGEAGATEHKPWHLDASAAYQQALDIRREMDQSSLAMESLAGLVRISLAQEDLEQAQGQVEEILSYLEENTLDGTEHPFHVYLTCYHTLRVNKDSRAEMILDTARRLLQEQAAKISDKEMRRSFLVNVTVHRQLLSDAVDQLSTEQLLRNEATPVAGESERAREADAHLASELAKAHRRIDELEAAEVERKRVEEALWESEKRFRSITETASDAIVIFDAHQSIFLWNQAAQSIFGYRAGEARGQLFTSMLSAEFHEMFQRIVEEVIETGESTWLGEMIEVIGIRQDGSQFPLELSLATWMMREKIFFTTIGRDITERKQAQARIERRAVQLQAATEVSYATTSMLDPGELMRRAVDLVRERFDLYYVGLFLLDEEGRFVVLRAGTGEVGQQLMAQNHKLEVGGDSMVGQCVTGTEALVALDAAEEAVRFDNPLLPDTRSEMVLPLRSQGRTIGAMTVQSVEEAAFDEADMAVMQTMTDQVAVAIDNAQLFAQTQAALEEAARAKESAEKAQEKAEQAREEAEAANQALEGQIWRTTGQARLSDTMRGEQDIPTLANNVIRQLCRYLNAQIGALYIAEDSTLNLVGRYAYTSRNPARKFKFGEGLVGQAALEKQLLRIVNIPNDYITVSSGLGETIPRHIMLCPFMYEDQVVGVVEMGTLTEFTPIQMEFLQTALANIGITFNTSQARARIDELLAETQQQAEELQAQGEELRVMNEELETQTESLRTSEAQLKEKQAILDQQNRELKVAQQELEERAEELALTSKYKSEFLANMSHELRTPLNSLLILARMLADNEEGNLTGDQVESAQIIYGSGNDLLGLINDILDLSKVEAGKMVFTIEPTRLADLVTAVRAQFTHVAEEKGLDLNIALADGLPVSIETDSQRVGQIVKNLLSNAFKFTDEGGVSLDIYRPDASIDLSRSGLNPTQAIAISVADTGIGMTPEQQKIIFEAFQQADGSTNRKYGGSGLGLSISRELAAKLGGQIDLESEPGQGSTFTLYLPIAKPAGERIAEPDAEEAKLVSLLRPSSPPVQSASAPASSLPFLADDRAALDPGNRILLIVEDDPKFAQIVYDYAHEKAFQCLIAGDGRTGLELVRTYQPTAIILDLNLPDISGWEVLEVLKYDPDTRHIPVHIMSVDEEILHAYRKGAMGYLTKPISREDLAASFQTIEQFISREIKTLLLVEDDARSRRSIQKLLGGSDVQIFEADGGRTALDLLKARHFDCMILDLNLPDMSGFEVLNEMNENGAFARCPVIIYTGRDLTPEENLELMQYADSVIVKGVKSPERLLDETALFLHRVVADMPQSKQQTIKQLYTQDTQLEGKTILIVDDDMRNSFALSKLLSDRGMAVEMAQTGQKALELLAENGDIDLVLMDIMMPGMDGYETTRRIRDQQEFRTLPILALTAKAMKGDREKCLEAGADDYLPKPVDVDRLFSMLRVWLYQ